VDDVEAESRRLERLWAGEFGDAYVDRNAVLDARRAAFWGRLLADHGISSVLEVGCGQGGNLLPISESLPADHIWGVDVNEHALGRARDRVPGANLSSGVARELPYPDRFVDLVFTVGVLIHQPEDSLHEVIGELARCARTHLLWGEYAAATTEEVPYRGVPGSLFRRDYASIFREAVPEFEVVDEGFLDPDQGFDRVTWQLLRRREA
jgi:pseudaminic acid biosynthesis-associated methylase